MRKSILLTGILLIITSTLSIYPDVATSQSSERREYTNCYAVFDRRGNMTDLYFRNNTSGCSKAVHGKGVITKVKYSDGAVVGFSVRYTDGMRESFDIDSYNNLPNSDRHLLKTLIRRNKRVGITSRGCGSGLFPLLESVKAL
jgi:hypothetical protein